MNIEELKKLGIMEYNETKLVKTRIARKLYKKLLAIWDDKMWALGIMDELYNNDVKIQKMIDIIDNGETDTDELGFLSEEI